MIWRGTWLGLGLGMEMGMNLSLKRETTVGHFGHDCWHFLKWRRKHQPLQEFEIDASGGSILGTQQHAGSRYL